MEWMMWMEVEAMMDEKARDDETSEIAVQGFVSTCTTYT